MDKTTAYNLGYAMRLGMELAKNPKIVCDGTEWITFKPNGQENKGRKILIDAESGQILGGSLPRAMQGTKIKDLKNNLRGQKAKNATYTAIKINNARPPSMSEPDQEKIHNAQNVEQLHLTPEQKHYISLYTEDGFEDLNYCLRNDLPLDDELMVKNLDEVINKMPAKEDFTVFRYCGNKVFSELENNGFIVDKGYLSTTTSEGCLQDFFNQDAMAKNPKFLIINVSKGTPAASIREVSSNDIENEILLKRNTRLTLRNKKKAVNNGVEAEYYYVDAT